MASAGSSAAMRAMVALAPAAVAPRLGAAARLRSFAGLAASPLRGDLLVGTLALVTTAASHQRLRRTRIPATQRRGKGKAAAAFAPAGIEDLGEKLDPAEALKEDGPICGVYEAVRPTRVPEISFVPVASLGSPDGPAMESKVWIRARLATVRVKGKSSFAVLREKSLHTVQCCKFKEKDDDGTSATQIAKFFKRVPLESVVDVYGTVVESNVQSCTQDNVEIQIERAYCVSASTPMLPFLLADASRSEAEIEESLSTDRPYVRVLPDLRLDHRWLDLRVPANNAILRIQGAVCRLFRDSLTKRGFVEIHSPKLIAGESEGGAEVFRADYFGKVATLAQSPQIYKQMAISADLPGVFEVGPVFRAENSNTTRHLCEFTGLDLEMPINWNYNEVLQVVHQTLYDICSGLEADCKEELEVIRKMYPSTAPSVPKEPCIIHWEEGNAMLKEKGMERNEMADLSTEEERTLGALVKEKYGVDLFFLDRYPSSVRPFYTMPNKDQPEYSNSYDLIFCGQEIGSGAQRCHDTELLEARCKELGVPMEPLQPYIDSFRHGVPPHGGMGLGLERIVQLYLRLDNIRKAVMFTRDPLRLSP